MDRGRPPGVLCDHVQVHQTPPHPSDAGSDARLDGLLADLDPRDLERSEPPAALWDRIAAAVAADTRAAAAGGSGGIVEYAIDADDLVVTLGAGWAEFASANDAHELNGDAARRSLWSQIGDETLRDLWRSAVARVRAQGAPVTVPFRCDGPTARRWFQMTLSPLPDGGVHFRSELTFEMTRPAVPLLGRSTPRDATLGVIAVCSWCAEASDGGTWLAVEELLVRRRLLEEVPAPEVSYGICPACTERHAPAALFPGPEVTSRGT